jgi:hypothetical protein
MWYVLGVTKVRPISVRRRGRCLKALLGSILVLSLAPCNRLKATLVIGIYNNDALYVGGDSLVTQGGANRSRTDKIFLVSQTCCVSIANNYGGYVRDANSGKVSLVSLPQELGTICSNALPIQPLESRIINIVTEFGNKYKDCVMRRLGSGTTDGDNETVLCFWGYDNLKNSFFSYGWRFSGTNRSSQVLFDNGSEPRIGGPITFQGETSFPAGLIYPIVGPPRDGTEPDKLSAFRTEELHRTIGEIYSNFPIATERVVNCMLLIFELHKNHAATFTTDKGWIDEPYVIYKITRGATVRLH